MKGRSIEVWFIAIFAAVVVIATIAVAFLSHGSTPSTPSGFVATTVPAITASDHSRNATGTPEVTLIEYGDFECPACGEYEPVVEQLQQEFAGKLQFVFRNFPLYQIHPNARIAAQAAEAAGLQGKYWEMHDLLYQKQNDWGESPNASVVTDYFDTYAQSLGLDVTKFNADITSSAVTDKVQHDLDTGNAAQIDHTPTFFINLTQIPNPGNYADFEAVINAAIASSTAS